jgi:putative transposase
MHVATSALTARYEVVAVENLNVAGMLRNHRLAGAVGDASFFEFRRQLEYKAPWRGGRVVVVDTWFPSSRLCHHCGWRNETLSLSDSRWSCGGCGRTVHRDFNAALNIRDEGLRILNSDAT